MNRWTCRIVLCSPDEDPWRDWGASYSGRRSLAADPAVRSSHRRIGVSNVCVLVEKDAVARKGYAQLFLRLGKIVEPKVRQESQRGHVKEWVRVSWESGSKPEKGLDI